MKLRLLSWNVRGVNDNSKRKVIKALIRGQMVDFFLSSGDKNPGNDRGCGEEFGHWKVSRLGCLGCLWLSGRDFDLLGQKDIGSACFGGGSILNFL